ncbi:hypothetical protein ACVIIV_003417 [Bradyrhizobium sp. USDA 4354]
MAKAAAMMASRYARAKQFRRHQGQLRILRSRLGPIIRDIRRNIEGQPALEEAFALSLGWAAQIRSQQQRQRGWKLLFLPWSGGGVHRQSQGRRALRVRREGLRRHQQSPRSRRSVRAARERNARQSV